MKYIIVLLMFITSSVVLAGNVRSLQTDADGNIVASIRGEGSIVSPGYSEGAWTPSHNADSNISGTLAFVGARYTRIGHLVHVSLGDITSLSIDSAGNASTWVAIDASGLPNFSTADSIFATSAYVHITASPREVIPVGVGLQGSNQIILRMNVSQTGAAGATTVSDIGFSYYTDE